MSRLPVALIWLLAVMAGALPAVRHPAEWRAHASILPADQVDVPSLFKPVRVERLQAGAPVRPAPWRGTPAADLACGRRAFEAPPAESVECSTDPLTFLVPASRLGTPRFPTGPPAA